MQSLSNPFKEKPIFMMGSALLLVSFLIFLFDHSTARSNFDFITPHFLLTYLSFIGIFIAVVADNKQETGKLFKFYNLSNNLILLLLGSASAYALNRDVRVFEPSADWFSWFLVLLNLAVWQVGFRKQFAPDWLNHLSVTVMSAGLLYGLYGSIYLYVFPFMALVVFWFFGLSLHLFVPLWWLSALAILLRKMTKAYPAYYKSLLVGFCLPLIFIIGFVVRWNALGKDVAAVYREEIAPLESRELPFWVTVGQKIHRDWMTEKILAAEMRAQFDFIFPSGVFTPGGDIRHDPIVGIASTLCPNAGLREADARQLKDALFESRHNTEPRLWSGDKLRTKDVVTNIEFFPEYRLAYTEKTLTIKHLGSLDERPQEAIYSFYLPEGGVVTSASLWIDGKESKALLTTREKAETAYNTIVGVENRDPLLVAWQEGGRITARIFPCPSEGIRQFKIGITAPLKLVDKQLVYENILFDGPPADDAEETIRLVGGVVPTASSFSFDEMGDYKEHKGDYSPDWSLEIAAPPLSQSPFSFNGQTFQLRPLPEVLEPFAYRNVYLDLNNGWNMRDFNEVWEHVKDKTVYACPQGCVKLEEANKDEVFRQMSRLNFSVFPLHKIEYPADAVVITKDLTGTPVPGDLKQSKFFEVFSAFYANQTKPIRVLNLGNQSNLWFKSLAASRAVQLHILPQEAALQLIDNQQFPANQEDAETIVLAQAGIKIKQLPNRTAGSSKAPDHLMRLFVYNDLMKKLAKTILTQTRRRTSSSRLRKRPGS